jgi:hypothetical protein
VRGTAGCVPLCGYRECTELALGVGEDLLAVLVARIVLVRVRGEMARAEDQRRVVHLETHAQPTLVGEHAAEARRTLSRLDVADASVRLPLGIDTQTHFPQRDALHHPVIAPEAPRHHCVPQCGVLLDRAGGRL